jgi:hypothetical protein
MDSRREHRADKFPSVRIFGDDGSFRTTPESGANGHNPSFFSKYHHFSAFKLLKKSWGLGWVNVLYATIRYESVVFVHTPSVGATLLEFFTKVSSKFSIRFVT